MVEPPSGRSEARDPATRRFSEEMVPEIKNGVKKEVKREIKREAAFQTASCSLQLNDARESCRTSAGFAGLVTIDTTANVNSDMGPGV